MPGRGFRRLRELGNRARHRALLPVRYHRRRDQGPYTLTRALKADARGCWSVERVERWVDPRRPVAQPRITCARISTASAIVIPDTISGR